MKKEMKKLQLLLRETVMRAKLAMPENEQDIKWHEEGIDAEKDEDFTERIFKELHLGLESADCYYCQGGGCLSCQGIGYLGYWDKKN